MSSAGFMRPGENESDREEGPDDPDAVAPLTHGNVGKSALGARVVPAHFWRVLLQSLTLFVNTLRIRGRDGQLLQKTYSQAGGSFCGGGRNCYTRAFAASIPAPCSGAHPCTHMRPQGSAGFSIDIVMGLCTIYAIGIYIYSTYTDLNQSRESPCALCPSPDRRVPHSPALHA